MRLSPLAKNKLSVQNRYNLHAQDGHYGCLQGFQRANGNRNRFARPE